MANKWHYNGRYYARRTMAETVAMLDVVSRCHWLYYKWEARGGVMGATTYEDNRYDVVVYPWKPLVWRGQVTGGVETALYNGEWVPLQEFFGFFRKTA